MATSINRADSVLHNLPSRFPPTPAVLAILSRFDRKQLHGFIAVAIDLADALDGDTDIEANGDELDGTGGEDDFCDHGYNYGAGCPVSDPDEAVDDQPCDACTEDGL